MAFSSSKQSAKTSTLTHQTSKVLHCWQKRRRTHDKINQSARLLSCTSLFQSINRKVDLNYFVRRVVVFGNSVGNTILKTTYHSIIPVYFLGNSHVPTPPPPLYIHRTTVGRFLKSKQQHEESHSIHSIEHACFSFFFQKIN